MRKSPDAFETVPPEIPEGATCVACDGPREPGASFTENLIVGLANVAHDSSV